MRTIACLALLTACGGELEVEYRGSLSNMEVSGLAFNVDEPTGHASMLGQTCEFNADGGGLMQDIDAAPSEEDEQVVDLWDHRLLAISPAGLHVVTLFEEVWEKPEIAHHALEDVVDAGFSADGELVALTRTDARCTVRWLSAGATLKLGACDPDVELVTDPRSRRAWVRDADAVFAVDPRRPRSVATGTHLAFNPQLDALYVSDRDELVRLDPLTGDEVWRRFLGGRITSISGHGPTGALAMNSRRTLASVDPDGGVRAAFTLPEQARVVGSGDGVFLAFLLDRSVHFHTLEL